MTPSYNEREVLALLHFRKNAGLLHLLLETAQGNVEVVIVVVEKNSGQEYHPLRRAGQAAKSTALQNMKSLYSAGLKKKQVPNLENQTREARRVLRRPRPTHRTFRPDRALEPRKRNRPANDDSRRCRRLSQKEKSAPPCGGNQASFIRVMSSLSRWA